MSLLKSRPLLIVSSAHGYGGAERSMELLAPELARFADVVVMTGNPRHRRNLLAAAEQAGVSGRLRVWRLPFDEGRKGTAGSVLGLAAARLWLRPAVVLANTERSARLVAWVARVWPGAGPSTWIYVRDFMWRVLPEVMCGLPRAGVLVPSPAVMAKAGYLQPWVEPCTRRRVRVMACPAAWPVSAVRPEAGGYALHLATVNPFKGHVHLLRAAELLRAEGRGISIRSRGMMDDGVLFRELEARISAAGLAGEGGFELLGHVEDPTEELHGCFCVVVSSVGHSGGPETFGRSIIEAWSHGVPVVAFAVGGPLHLIEHEKDGLLVAEGDERGLAEALWRLRTEPGLAARLGAQGREKVRRDYECGLVAERLRAVLTEPA